ncbi:MAG: hypothetical protein M3O22_00300 [Pseudomonadota bacterium]|nr:hypothetical protein [Pseudomonadota bacterium]
MPTFASLKTSAAKRLMDDSNTAVSASDVGDSVNAAIRFWKQKRFWFNQATATPTLTEDDPDITGMPSAFLYELSQNGFVIEYASSRYPLVKVDNNFFDAKDSEGVGLPAIYTYRNGGYQVCPYPDQAYTLKLYYIKDYSDLSGDSDTNDFTAYADRLVLYEALSRLHGELRQDEKMEAYYSARAAAEYQNLQTRTAMLIGTGTLSVDTIL